MVPVLIDAEGLVVDGRHRIKVCTELGVDVECVNLVKNASKTAILEAANTNEFSGRVLTPTQKAFRVVDMVKAYGYSQVLAMKKLGFTDTKAIAGVNYSYNNEAYVRMYVDRLKAGKDVEVQDIVEGIHVYRGKSLRRIVSTLKEVEEKNSDPITDAVDEEAESKIDYDEFLDTERAKREFWSRFGMSEAITMENKLFIIDCLNARYTKAVEDVEREAHNKAKE